MKNLPAIFILAVLLLTSCSEKIESPESQLLNELKEQVSKAEQVSTTYLIKKSKFLCEYLDCNKERLSIDGYEFLIAGRELMFMHGNPNHFVLESWNENPQIRWVVRNK